ncbi:protein FAM71B [Dermochelys coriacea]|uniref:protein FAM71B n=1 Tax=Dermochelys coriacea TaxID=27794 RepID=UPI001CA88EBE|nr:protein FAM71B [Dermochelys coriacea]
MIIARPMERSQGEPLGPRTAHAPPELELTRLIPLEQVSLYLHDMGEQRLKLRLATGRVYYLKLCAPRGEERPLFARWLRLTYLLRVPLDSWASIPSWHTSDLHGRSAKQPHSQRLWPIQEEEEPRTLIPQLGEPPGSGSWTPSQGQLRGRQRLASPITGQQPSTRSVGGQGSRCPTSPSIAALVRRSPKLLDDLSGSQAEVTSPWTQGPVSRELSAERNCGQLSLAIPSGSRSPAGIPRQHGSSAGSRATMAPGSPERSRASVGVGRSAVATASVGMGCSAVATVSAAAGPSRPASARPSGMGGEMEPGERCRKPSTEMRRTELGCSSPSTEQGRSCSQSQRGSNAASRAAVAPGSPERSRASVGVGRSAGGTASVGVGRSLPSTASVAAGPSRLASTQPSGMEPDRRSGERSQAQLGHTSPSTEQGHSHFRSQHGSSAALGPTGGTVTPSSHGQPSGSRAPSFLEPARSPLAAAAPLERSQLSGGVGPSEVATAALAMDPSGQRSWSSSWLDRAERQGRRSRETAGESGKGKARSSSGSPSHKRPSK